MWNISELNQQWWQHHHFRLKINDTQTTELNQTHPYWTKKYKKIHGFRIYHTKTLLLPLTFHLENGWGKKKYSQISHCNKTKTDVRNPPLNARNKTLFFLNSNTLRSVHFQRNNPFWKRCAVASSKQSHCYVLLLRWNIARTQFYTTSADL